MIARLKVGKGVTGAVRYGMGEGRDPETMQYRTEPANGNSRVDWVSGINLPFPIEDASDVDLARRIMEFDAQNQTSRTKKCVYDCVHLSLGWRPGEHPTRQHMEEAAHSALVSLGMGNAKAIFIAHNDEDYFHLHVVASKLNPETERAYDLKRSHLKLSKWAEQYERDNGGIVHIRRAEANQLREAIDKRDAGLVLELLTEQRSTFTGRDLERVLDKQIISKLDRAQFAETILNQPGVVRLSDQADGKTSHYSTRTIIEIEAHALRATDGLARSNTHQARADLTASILSGKEYDKISREQARAVRHVTGPSGIAMIDGQAGAGKSFTMAAARKIYEAEGYKVVGLAPTNKVAQQMRETDGFSRSATVHSELFNLNAEQRKWDQRTVVMVDEAAMIGSRNMAMLTAHAHQAGAKLILVGDDRQLASIERGGLFSHFKERYGAAALSEVRRQVKLDERRASELMAEGNFYKALEIYNGKGAIKWTRTQPEARASLVEQWKQDSAAAPDKTRFVFAYTNADVDRLNLTLRNVRRERGEIQWEGQTLDTKHGPAEFSAGDRIQFTGRYKATSFTINNGDAGTVQAIDGSKVRVQLDSASKKKPVIEIDAAAFKDFRHGYAGTIYKGQGATLDQTYLYHTEHWRSASGYVALTRHRDKAAMFVATNTAPDLTQLARQMGRVDDRRAASAFHQSTDGTPTRPLTPRELAVRLNQADMKRRSADTWQGPETAVRREPARAPLALTKAPLTPGRAGPQATDKWHGATSPEARQQREESDRRQSIDPAARAANDLGRPTEASQAKDEWHGPKAGSSEKKKTKRVSDRDRAQANDRDDGGRERTRR